MDNWFPADGSIWGGIGDAALVTESVSLVVHLEVSKPSTIPSVPLCFLLVVQDMSALVLLPCLPPAAVIPCHDGYSPSGTVSLNKLFLLQTAWVTMLYHSNGGIVRISLEAVGNVHYSTVSQSHLPVLYTTAGLTHPDRNFVTVNQPLPVSSSPPLPALKVTLCSLLVCLHWDS